MATPKQIAANRRNAKRSTGPKTPQGKQLSSKNACKTGAYSKHSLLQDEDPAELGRLRNEYYRDWKPASQTERHLVERLITLSWRMARCLRAETGMIASLRKFPKGIGGVASAYLRDLQNKSSLAGIADLEAKFQKRYDTTIGTLEKLQRSRVTRKIIAATDTENAQTTAESADAKAGTEI